MLKNFVDLDEIEKVLVFGWRNHLKIAPLMRTQTITLKEHLQFMESLKQDSTKQYFLALQDDEILGVLCFIDIQHGISCEFGIYQNPDLKGYGAALMEAMLKYAQETLGVVKIYACALNTNQKAISLYQRFGFQFTNKDAQMSYFVFSAGGGQFVALKATLLHFFATQTTILATQDYSLLAYKIHKASKNVESQSLRAIPSPFLSLCA